MVERTREEAAGGGGVGADALAALQELAQAFLALEHATSFYPEGHRAREAPLARCHRSFVALAAPRGDAVLAVSEEELLWEGRFHRDLPPALARLADFLREQGISRLAWTGGLAPEELQRLMSRLVARRGAASRVSWAEEEQIPHLFVGGVDYKVLLEEDAAEGEERRRRDLWKELLLRCLAEEKPEFTPEELELLRGRWEDDAAMAALILEALGPAAAQGGPETVEGMRRLVGALEQGAGGAGASGALRDGLRRAGTLFPDALRFRLLESSLGEVSPGLFAEAFGSVSPGDLVALLAGNFALDPDQLVRLSRVFQHLVPRQLDRMELFPLLKDRVERGAPAQEPIPESAWDEVQELLTGEAGDFMSASYREQLQRIARRQGRRREAEAALTLLPELAPALEASRVDEETSRIHLENLHLATSAEQFGGALASVGARARAALAAGDIVRGAALLEPVVRLLDDGERGAFPRAPVEETLRDVAAPEALERLVPALGTLGEAEQSVFSAVLARAPEEAVPRLLEALAVEEDPARRRALLAPFSGFGRAALPQMLARLEGGSPAAARALIPLLGELREDAAVPALLRILHGGEPRLRREALRALVRIDSPEVRRILPGLLEDRDEEIVQTAAAHLGGIGHEGAKQDLLRTLGRGRLGGLRGGEMRRAILALGRMRAAEAAAPLGELLRRRAWIKRRAQEELCVAAAQALQRIGTGAAREALAQAVEGAPASLAAVYRGLLARWDRS